MNPLCDYCGNPATHYNPTQFAGTHHTCNYHWNQLEAEEQDAYLCIETREESQDAHYTKHWPGKVSFDATGKPQVELRTTTYSPSNFDELFIQMLADYVALFEPSECGLQRAHEFRELYIQVMLEAKDEFNPNKDYTLP